MNKERLTGRTDPSGTYTFYYDPNGNLNKEEKTINSILYTTQYTYNNNNILISITYPSGRVITYTPDQVGRISQVSTTLNGQPKTLASAIDYLPFGGIKALTYGNALTLNQGYDNQYRISSIVTGSILNLTYGYDPNCNVNSILDAINPPGGQALETPGTYSYQTGTNKLTHIATTPSIDYGYDLNGNITTENTWTYVYDLSNQLIRVLDGANQVGEYTFNGAGQRIKKVTQTETRIFHYDSLGHIIAETNQSGQMLAEYVYLGDQLLAMIKQGELAYYFHNDHLGTPQVLTDGNGTVAWKAAYTPFGDAVVSVQTVENPFRFPGQYYDPETGLHYNYFRYYDPMTGRYVTPDPIGLEGGINLFVYVQNNPVNWTDYLGLLFITPEQAQLFAKIARTWKDTPFGEVGKGSKKGIVGDCSGSTYYIIREANFPHEYLRARDFPESPYFRPAPDNIPQVGDVGWWPSHVLIYDPNIGGGYNSWSARRGLIPYGPADYQIFEKKYGPVKWFRYYFPDR